MSKIFIDDLKIEVQDFLYHSDRNNKFKLSDSQNDENILFSGIEPKHSQFGVLELEFFDKLDKLKGSFYRISKEDEEVLNSIFRKYI